jgi:hypothetical protein
MIGKRFLHNGKKAIVIGEETVAGRTYCHIEYFAPEGAESGSFYVWRRDPSDNSLILVDIEGETVLAQEVQ